MEDQDRFWTLRRRNEIETRRIGENEPPSEQEEEIVSGTEIEQEKHASAFYSF